MGYVRVGDIVGGVGGLGVSFLVDTGAFCAVIGPSLAEDLGVKPVVNVRLSG
ncbi:aspartyl protease family protein [Vulcanisaeta distributa]|uniref:Peptidase A2 domain-containing protein n=1 Tax=Vulcanisaeta distributa (strain DSM 14429 / JCM 11212 / NBRC 100878 / IC-017) TaxID=572478 RepID=E1QQA5_VULDI|nr:aspartyl protease family protein [Vulcanisaeta distributa]ADN51592.1 hypothetical protein Vdis_2224 [Vulcanisaeta distributa DSM 14429]